MLLVLACEQGVVGGDTAPPLPAFEVGEEVRCEQPAQGWDRFAEEGAARGITGVLPEVDSILGMDSPGVGGALVLDDLDGDGDVDLLAGALGGFPDVYTNDGTGHFTRSKVWLEGSLLTVAILAVNLDEDLLPELVVPADGGARWYRNLGGMRWELGGRVEVARGWAFLTAVAGDADGDGQVDVALISSDRSGDMEPGEFGGPDWVLRWDGEAFVPYQELVVDGTGGRAQVATFTDRDQDGDQDLLVPADLGPPSAFWRNDEGRFTDDAADVGAAMAIAAMGVDSADLNGDGWLDYCFTDVGEPRCLASDGLGGWYEGAWEFPPDVVVDPRWPTVGWSVELADFDNDGRVELFQASSADPGSLNGGYTEFPDLLFAGPPFEDVSDEAGLADTAHHIGAATADVDGDGSLDLVVAGPGMRPKLYMNACTEGAWLDLDFIGPPGNTGAVGVRVEAAGQVRELMSLRGKGQGPRRVHLGLGALDQVEVRVTFPDGVELQATLPTRRRVRVRHPDAQTDFAPWTGERAPSWQGQEGFSFLQGLVRDGLGPDPVPGATVALGPNVVEPAPDGSFTLNLMSAPTVELHVAAPGRTPALLEVDPRWQLYPALGLTAHLFEPADPVAELLLGGGGGGLVLGALGTLQAEVSIGGAHRALMTLVDGELVAPTHLGAGNLLLVGGLEPTSGLAVELHGVDGGSCSVVPDLDIEEGVVTTAFALCE